MADQCPLSLIDDGGKHLNPLGQSRLNVQAAVVVKIDSRSFRSQFEVQVEFTNTCFFSLRDYFHPTHHFFYGYLIGIPFLLQRSS